MCAATEGPAQAAAFAWLGRFYRKVASDTARARKCLQKALALDATQADAGAWTRLCGFAMLASGAKLDVYVCLCSRPCMCSKGHSLSTTLDRVVSRAKRLS